MTAGQKGGDNLSGQPAVKATQPSIGKACAEYQAPEPQSGLPLQMQGLDVPHPKPPMMHSGMHDAGVPVVADKTKCTKTPSDERKGEDAAIGEPAEALTVIKAPEALLSETGN